MILYQDESGGMSWHFAQGSQSAADATLRGLRSPDVFVIPARTSHAVTALQSPQSGPRLRGPITKWGRKIFKVLLVPAGTTCRSCGDEHRAEDRRKAPAGNLSGA